MTQSDAVKGGDDVEVVNLKGVELPAAGCGQCSGSSSDAVMRSDKSRIPEDEDRTPVAAAA